MPDVKIDREEEDGSQETLTLLDLNQESCEAFLQTWAKHTKKELVSRFKDWLKGDEWLKELHRKNKSFAADFASDSRSLRALMMKVCKARYHKAYGEEVKKDRAEESTRFSSGPGGYLRGD